MYIILIILVILLIVGAPGLGFHSYGWGPSGVLGIILIVVIVWLLMGRGL